MLSSPAGHGEGPAPAPGLASGRSRGLTSMACQPRGGLSIADAASPPASRCGAASAGVAGVAPVAAPVPSGTASGATRCLSGELGGWPAPRNRRSASSCSTYGRCQAEHAQNTGPRCREASSHEGWCNPTWLSVSCTAHSGVNDARSKAHLKDTILIHADTWDGDRLCRPRAGWLGAPALLCVHVNRRHKATKHAMHQPMISDT